jgi:hypothetical protein
MRLADVEMGDGRWVMPLIHEDPEKMKICHWPGVAKWLATIAVRR